MQRYKYMRMSGMFKNFKPVWIEKFKPVYKIQTKVKIWTTTYIWKLKLP